MTPAQVELKREIDELRERVDALERDAGEANGCARPREGWKASLPPWIELVDGRTLVPLMERVLREMGIDPSHPGITAQELREQMIRDGVDPAERMGNTILEQMRRERA